MIRRLRCTVEYFQLVNHFGPYVVGGLTRKRVQRGPARGFVWPQAVDHGDDRRRTLLRLLLLWLPLLGRRCRLGGGRCEPALDGFEWNIWAIIAVKEP